jgi:hypothetical protein
MVSPPFMEGLIQADIKSLFGRRSLCKSVRNIHTIISEVFCCRNPREDASAGLINIISVCLVKDSDLTRVCGPVTSAASLLATIDCFDAI